MFITYTWFNYVSEREMLSIWAFMGIFKVASRQISMKQQFFGKKYINL